MKKNNRILFISITTFILFTLWTASLYFIDVKPIAPSNSNVGYSTINKKNS